MVELLELLEAQRDHWSELSSTMDITDTEAFGEEIRQVAASHSCPPLERWGEALASCSRDFDITGVQTIIGQFSDAIDRLRAWSEDQTQS